MTSCTMMESTDPSLCPFNPSVWSASAPNQVPVAKLFGTTQAAAQFDLEAQYQRLRAQIDASFRAFNATFLKSAQEMHVELFTADGDFLHDYFDCIFLGPYSRVDLLPCDLEGKLEECPFYARDEQGGMTRDFTACFGPIMYGDEKLPFTCGSRARRSIIKYFFRDRAFSGESLRSEVTSLLYEKVKELWAQLTNTQNYGCLNETTGQCTPQACKRSNAYRPCVDLLDWTVSAQEVSQFFLKYLLKDMEAYYAFVMQARCF